MKQYKCIHPYYIKNKSEKCDNITNIPLGLIVTKGIEFYFAKAIMIEAFKVENNSINWQEIPQKEYEILSFKVISTGKIIKEHFPGYTELDYTGSNRHWDIYSIKRLSDNQIFTIGDEVKHCRCNRDYGKIYEFKISNNEICASFKGLREDNPEYKYYNCIRVLDKVLQKSNKEYIILSSKGVGSGKIWKHDSQLRDQYVLEDGKAPFNPTEHFLLYPKAFTIHSIQRLSDNEVFTIGDKINKPKSTESLTINGFEIMNSGSLIIYTNEENGYFGGEKKKGIHYTLISKPKIQPLFTTEDSVDIFDGDNCYHVWERPFKWEVMSYKAHKGTRNERVVVDPWSAFSHCFGTKKLAQEYINNNQPKLSLNDISEVINLTDNMKMLLLDIINSKK